MKNKMFSYPLILLFVSFISAYSITLLNEITQPILELREMEQLEHVINNNLRGIYPEMTKEYTILSDKINQKTAVMGIFALNFKNTEEKKYVYNVKTNGKNGNINFLIVFSEEQIIEELIFISHKETSGRGDKIEKPEFINKILGQNTSNIKIDNITGATYSSNAVKKGVEQASYHMREVLFNE